jgi:hypothetical protein
MLMSMMGIQQEPSEEIDEESLRERFVKKIYDDRFNEALPYVYRAYKHRQKMDTPGSKEFESWANDVTEATWEADADDRDETELLAIVQAPLAVGFDGTDAIAALSGLIDDESLGVALRRLSANQGPDADARRTLAGWLASNGESSLANQIIQIMQSQAQPTEPAPPQPTPQPQSTGATTMDAPVVSEELDSMMRLAGLK